VGARRTSSAPGRPSRCERLVQLERERRYGAVVDLLAEFVGPVEQFFADVLVIDPGAPQAMVARQTLLDELRGVLTRCFDIRELAGQAERRS
jgi:glycyl-tRNA synthetase beta subunit